MALLWNCLFSAEGRFYDGGDSKRANCKQSMCFLNLLFALPLFFLLSTALRLTYNIIFFIIDNCLGVLGLIVA
jgi:hypothetical protein